ncbi:hypothetical protein J8L70_07570 [Pseudoalteromonas sp. MMG010]|uniref:BcsR/BcsP family cellulose biosynthesis protein n=1 Tax=Pseudoalteromonas sp. MMG010 TaxID=2822685 RepID=UPI001B3A2122|nr:BcsR/BcsP family cellulose biosynthesis protein [Pseudoalteromonas sp. MMG010]MBQ4833095.1 hypothetical protein [Pseudoalteromonas sp. MMG010]
MQNIEFKSIYTLTKSDIDNLVNRFGGDSTQYLEITDSYKNNQTIKKYPLIKEIQTTFILKNVDEV